MRNHVIQILLCLLFSGYAFSSVLSSEFKNKFESHLTLADSFYLLQNDSGLYHASQAFETASKIKDDQLKAKAMLRLGHALSISGPLDSASLVLKRACNIFQKLNDQLNTARTLNAIGLISFYQGEYRLAMADYLEALTIFEKYNDQDGLGAVYINLSGIYEILGDHELDLNYSKRAARVYKNQGNLKQYAICLNNMAHTYNQIGQYTMAIKYLQKSIKIKKEFDAKSSLAYSYATLSESYRLKKDVKTGMMYLDSALNLFTLERNAEGLVETNKLLGEYYADEGVYNQAIDHALTAYMLAKESGLKKAQMDLSNELSNYYLAANSRKKASDFQSRFLMLKDSLLNSNIGEDIMNAQVAYELNKKSYHFKLKAQEEKASSKILVQTNDLVNVISIVVIIFLATVQIVAIFYYWNKRKRPKLGT